MKKTHQYTSSIKNHNNQSKTKKELNKELAHHPYYSTY